MDEQILNTQPAPETLEKPAKSPKVLVIVALVAFVLALVLDFIPSLLVIFEEPDFDEFIREMTSMLAYNTRTLLRVLLLPVALLLLGNNTKKATWGKVFLGVSVLFLLAQLFSAAVMGIVELDYSLDIDIISNSFRNYLYTALSWISGSDLFDQPIYFLFTTLVNLFDYGFDIDFLEDLVYCVCYGTSALLYILGNVICAIGFAKMAFTKKK